VSWWQTADVQLPEFAPRRVTIRNDKDFADEFRTLDLLGRQVSQHYSVYSLQQWFVLSFDLICARTIGAVQQRSSFYVLSHCNPSLCCFQIVAYFILHLHDYLLCLYRSLCIYLLFQAVRPVKQTNVYKQTDGQTTSTNYKLTITQNIQILNQLLLPQFISIEMKWNEMKYYNLAANWNEYYSIGDCYKSLGSWYLVVELWCQLCFRGELWITYLFTYSLMRIVLKLMQTCITNDWSTCVKRECRGKFGEVKRCVERSTGREFAAKFIATPRPQDRKDVEHEVDMVCRLHHRRLAQLYDAFQSDNEMCLVIEM